MRGIESLTVFADYDEAGLKATRAVYLRYMAAGVNANFLRPKRAGEDYNDMVLRKAQP